ncbi:MAG: hypothetical protein ABIZ80_04155, partial [Bryobacteraceae bacterium]
MSRGFPYLFLLIEILLFFRKIVFLPGSYLIPYDLPFYHLPIAELMAKAFREGRLPLWDPFTYCGFPIYANLTQQLFYPPMVAATLVSNWTGGQRLFYFLELQLVAHVFLAGIFTYWLMRRLGAGIAAALVGASVYQLGPFFASQTQHIGAIDTAAWMPLALLAVIELAAGFSRRWLAVLAAALAMSILAGFPAVTVVVFTACGLLAATLSLLRRASWTLLPALAGACVAAAALSAVQLLPTMELSGLSVARFRSDWLGDGGGHPVQSLITMLIPNYWGIFQFDANTYKLPWNPTFLFLYLSLAGLLLALTAAVWHRTRYHLPFAVLTVCGLFWMLGEHTPIGLTVFRLMPNAVKTPIYAEYALPLFGLGMAVLAGLGAESLPWRRIKTVLPVLIAADLILFSSGRPINMGLRSDQPGLGYDHFDDYRDIPPKMRELVNQTYPAARIDILNGSVNWAGDAPLFEVPTANGNDPFALERIIQVRLVLGDGERWQRLLQVARPQSPVLDLMNVRYLVSSAPIAGPFPQVAELHGQYVHENPRVLPRFYFVERVRAAKDLATATALLRASDFDPRREAVVEGVAPAAGGTGTVTVRRYEPLAVTLDVDAPAPAFLATSEAYYPGWRATIDGAEA